MDLEPAREILATLIMRRAQMSYFLNEASPVHELGALLKSLNVIPTKK